MKVSNQFLMRTYGVALQLYPAAFRTRYETEMRETVARMHAESTDDLGFVARLASDVLTTSLREHLRAAGAPTPQYGVAFVCFLSGLLLVVSVGHQQWLRRKADRDPTALMARVLQPHRPLDSGVKVEIASESWLGSTVPFAVVYDEAGRATEGSATLHGALPQPPPGIFDTIRQRGNNKVTWQPQRGIRVALVGEKMPNGGFVLAGQSLIGTESNVARFNRQLLWMWGLMAAAVLLVVARVRRQTTHFL